MIKLNVLVEQEIIVFKNLFQKGQKKDLIAEIKKEFPKEGGQGNERELLHKGLDEGNNLYVENFLLSESEFNIAELAVVDDKSKEEIKEATEAKARALALYDRWKKI